MKFLNCLQKTGDIIQACVESGLSAEQYQDKLKNEPGFADSVNSILTNHSLTIDRKIQQIGKEKFLELLEHGSTVHKQSRRVIYDDTGEICRQELKTEAMHFPTPEWAIKHAMSQSSDVENALMVLAQESMIPQDIVRKALSVMMQSKKDIRGLLGESGDNTAELSQQAIVEAQAALLGLTPDQLTSSNS